MRHVQTSNGALVSYFLLRTQSSSRSPLCGNVIGLSGDDGRLADWSSTVAGKLCMKPGTASKRRNAANFGRPTTRSYVTLGRSVSLFNGCRMITRALLSSSPISFSFHQDSKIEPKSIWSQLAQCFKELTNRWLIRLTFAVGSRIRPIMQQGVERRARRTKMGSIKVSIENSPLDLASSS